MYTEYSKYKNMLEQLIFNTKIKTISLNGHCRT